MSEHLFEDPNHEYSEARAALKAALENVDYLSYSIGSGPLLVEEITDGTKSDILTETIDEYQWPSDVDAIIEPVEEQPSNEAFLDSMKEGDRPLHTQPLYTFLSTMPTQAEEVSGRGWIFDIYGQIPVVHRAHALAPELFDNLATVLSALNRRYPTTHAIEDPRVSVKEWTYELLSKPTADNLYNYLREKENQDIVEAMHMAYRIMGRLMKVNDGEIANEKRALPYESKMIAPTLSAKAVLRWGG